MLATGASATPLDQIEVQRREELLSLSWADTEERLQGSVSPAVPLEGQPLRVTLQVGRFEGEPFEGPLILTLRESGATHGQTVTVERGERFWRATFTPEHSGPHQLDVSFRTTHLKVLHARLDVEGSPVPRKVGWGALALGTLLLIGYSAYSILRGERPAEQAPASEAPPPPPSAPVDGTTTVPGTEPSEAPPSEDVPPTSR